MAVHLLVDVLPLLAAVGPAFGLLIIWIVAVRRGLYPTPAPPFRLTIHSHTLEITKRTRSRSFPLGGIARARYAYDDGWTRSTLVEDALTLFDSTGRRLAKIPATAQGWDALFEELRARGLPIESINVDAPSYLD